MHCTKSRPSPYLAVKGQRSRSPGTRNEKVRHFFRERSSRCVVRQFYAGGKISACCLVLSALMPCCHYDLYVITRENTSSDGDVDVNSDDVTRTWL